MWLSFTEHSPRRPGQIYERDTLATDGARRCVAGSESRLRTRTSAPPSALAAAPRGHSDCPRLTEEEAEGSGAAW